MSSFEKKKNILQFHLLLLIPLEFERILEKEAVLSCLYGS